MTFWNFRVSFCEVSIDDSVRQKQKSSGVTVCTGTGSTSWFFNINHLTTQSVHDILKIGMPYNKNIRFTGQPLLKCFVFNQNIVYFLLSFTGNTGCFCPEKALNLKIPWKLTKSFDTDFFHSIWYLVLFIILSVLSIGSILPFVWMRSKTTEGKLN